MAYKVTDAGGAVITATVPAQTHSFGGHLGAASRLNFQVGLGAGLMSIAFDYPGWSGGTMLPPWTVSAQAGSTSNSTTGTGSGSDPYDLSGSSYSFSSFTIERRFDTGGGSWVNGVPDGVGFTTRREYWYIPAGQSITATLNVASFGSITVTGTTTGTEWTGENSAAIEAFGFIAESPGMDRTVSCSLPFSPATSLPTESASDADDGTGGGGASASVTVSSGSLSVNCSGFNLGGGGSDTYQTVTASGSAISYPDIPVSVRYRIEVPIPPPYPDEGALYPDAISVDAAMAGDNPSVHMVGPKTPFTPPTSLQRQYTVIAAVSSSPHPVTNSSVVNTYGPVSMSINTASLLAQGEDLVTPGTFTNSDGHAFAIPTTPLINRLPFRSNYFDGLKLSLAPTFVISQSTVLANWSATGGGAVSSSSGIRIAATGTPGGATLAITPTLSCLSYRFLRVTISGAPVVFDLTIPAASTDLNEYEYPTMSGAITYEDLYSGGDTGSKTYHVTTAMFGTSNAADIDLCCPTSVNGGAIRAGFLDRGTRWPIPTRMGDIQGVWRAEQIQISGIAAGSSLTIQDIRLCWRTQPSWDVLDQWNHSLLRTDGASGNPFMMPEWIDGETRPETTNGSGSITKYYDRRGLLCMVDGRQGVEETFFSYSRFEGASGVVSYNFVSETIDTLVTKLGIVDGPTRPGGGIRRYPGLTATKPTPYPSTAYTPTYAGDCPPDSYYYNSTGPAHWLTNRFNTVIMPAVFEGFSVTLKAADLVDQITPTWGMDWSLWEAFAVLRGTAQGIVVNSGTGKALGGFGLSLIEDDAITGGSTGSIRGTATSGAGGFYSTELPTGRGPNHPHHIEQQSGVHLFDWANTAWRARYRHRACWLGSIPQFGPIAIDSPRAWLHLAGGPVIQTYHLGTMTRAFSSAAYTGIDHWVHLTHDPRNAGRLIMLGVQADGSTFKTYTSGDGGQTGTQVNSVAAANSAAIERDSERGWIVQIYGDSGTGHLMRQVCRDGGTTWETAAACQLGGAAMAYQVIDLAQDPRAAGVMVMAAKDGGGNQFVFKSTDVGSNWVQVLP